MALRKRTGPEILNEVRAKHEENLRAIDARIVGRFSRGNVRVQGQRYDNGDELDKRSQETRRVLDRLSAALASVKPV